MGVTTQQAPLIPKEWPTQVVKLFDPLKILGDGADFSPVMLARRKDFEPGVASLVAIKIVGSKKDVVDAGAATTTTATTHSGLEYARRERDILKELGNHPNIVKMIEYWEPPERPTKSKICCAPAVLALSYARGPSVEVLLQHGGAFSTTFGRAIIAQAVDAVSFLQLHAVVHLDIRPQNIIVTGASIEQQDIWDDSNNASNASSWEDTCKKWHVTLIGFGFAHALTPEADVSDIKPSLQQPEEASKKQNIDLLPVSSTSSLDRSIRLSFARRVNALGNSVYCAPEIMKAVDYSFKTNVTTTSGSGADVSENVSGCVSEYGLMSDAYSLGLTFRYLMTGVPPNRGIEESIAEQMSLPKRLARWTKNKLSTAPLKQKRQLRLRTNLPNEAQLLISGLSKRSETHRLSVREARRSPWIAEILPKADDGRSQHLCHLKCAEGSQSPVPESFNAVHA